jgi:hypothetical protein
MVIFMVATKLPLWHNSHVFDRDNFYGCAVMGLLAAAS